MIAKIVTRKQDGDFKRLAAYVLNEKDKGRGDAVDWKLADYILDEAHAGEKVASHRITNCISDDPGWAVKECLVLAARNTRSTKDKSYHLVVSFPPGERPTDEQMVDIEDTLVAAVGLEDHKRISAVHQDKKHWHLHIAIVTVHPRTLRNVTPYYDHYKLQEACVALEIKHDLARTEHVTSPERVGGRTRAATMEAHSGRKSFHSWVVENAAEPLGAAARTATTWQDLHQAAAEYGLLFKPRGAGMVVVNTGYWRAAMKASAIDRSLSFQTLTYRLGPYQPPSPSISSGKPAMSYAGAPRGADPSLWAQYQQERDQAKAERAHAITEMRFRHLKYAQDLAEWYRGRHAAARAAHLNKGDRISTRRALESDFAADTRRRKQMEIDQRQVVKEKYVVPTWDGFLARAAAHGDRAAQMTLERRIEALIQREQDQEREGLSRA